VRCKNCNQEFPPTKSWQVFCQTRCREIWHYQQKVQQEREEQIEAARDELEDRRNGLSAASVSPTLTLASLGIRSVEPMKRPMRRLA
jgi:hypothetical protein